MKEIDNMHPANEKEKKELIELLNQPSDKYQGYSKWQDIIVTYNDDNFNLSFNQTVNGEFDKAQRNSKMPKHLVPLPIDLPMPDYMKL